METGEARHGAPRRPGLTVSAVFRAHRDRGGARPAPGSPAGRAYDAIARCRTADAGGHLERCLDCGFERPVYNSCRNRHCPGCQSYAQKAWLDRRIERVLPVPHFHVVFTLPSELRALAQANKQSVYDVLFQAAAETLQMLGEQKLGATLGVTAVLHTWTRTLAFHPHLHCIVTGGGLARTGDRWIAARQNYLFPVAVMRALFRGKVLAFLRERAADLVGFDPAVLRGLRHRKWVVYAKRPFGGAEAIFAYLGRYTHRVGISNQRLVEMNDEHVTFRTRGDQRVRVTLETFVTRFLAHVLPSGYRKIRHYGLLAPACVRTKLLLAERLLRKPARAPAPPPEGVPLAPRCPHCDALLVRMELGRAREPPSSWGGAAPEAVHAA